MTDESGPPHTDSGATPPDIETLDRYLAGECLPAEAASVRRRLHAVPSGMSPDEAAQALRRHPAVSQTGAREPAVDWATFKTRIPDGGASPQRSRFSSIRVLASGIGLAAAAGLVFFVQRTHVIGSTLEAPPSRTYTTATSQRATVTLADGSTVVLAPQTSLTVAAGFGDDTRTVSLSGEAYFTVAPGAHTPFFVRTGNVETRVLGTAFDVRRYHTDRETRVAVTTGRVSVSAVGTTPGRAVGGATHHPVVVLAAGMIGRVTDSTATATTVDDVIAYAKWTDGTIVFRDTPVPEVLATLGRWYGYEFRLADSALAGQHLSAVFNYGNANEMLTALQTLLGATVTLDGQVVTVHQRRLGSAAPARYRIHDSLTRHDNRELGR